MDPGFLQPPDPSFSHQNSQVTADVSRKPPSSPTSDEIEQALALLAEIRPKSGLKISKTPAQLRRQLLTRATESSLNSKSSAIRVLKMSAQKKGLRRRFHLPTPPTTQSKVSSNFYRSLTGDLDFNLITQETRLDSDGSRIDNNMEDLFPVRPNQYQLHD